MEFLRPTLYKTIYLTVFCAFFYGIIIYVFNMPIYYRFSTQSVIIFYFFWKLIGFIMIFDRLYSKIWLEKKLRFQSLHSHGIQWGQEMDKIKRKLSSLFFENVGSIGKDKSQKVQEEMNRFISSNVFSLREIYEGVLNKYYVVSVQQFISKYEREANLKLQTKWHDYLNYMLILDLIGIIGFGSLLIFSFFDELETLFWVGFVLALIELIVFEISNVVFSLHCFFIELYRNIQLQQAQKEEELDKDDDFTEQSQL